MDLKEEIERLKALTYTDIALEIQGYKKTIADNAQALQLQQTGVSGCYVGTQTPIERMRNKLTPFINIIELLESEDNITLPFIDKSENSEFKNDIFERLLETCIKYKQDIKTHLSDCDVFYNNR